jgi:SNF2 family DNA or RNA helicase
MLRQMSVAQQNGLFAAGDGTGKTVAGLEPTIAKMHLGLNLTEVTQGETNTGVFVVPGSVRDHWLREARDSLKVAAPLAMFMVDTVSGNGKFFTSHLDTEPVTSDLQTLHRKLARRQSLKGALPYAELPVTELS